MIARNVVRRCALAMGLCACSHTEDLAPGAIEAPRILAVRTTPPEAGPNQVVKREVLAVDALGQPLPGLPHYARCDLPKALGDRGEVGQACLSGFGLVPIAADAAIDAMTCRRFGPTPNPLPGDDARPRPVPPDQNGGYYAPEAVRIPGPTGDLWAFFRVRTKCDLLGSTRDIFDAFNRQYRPNTNPELRFAELFPAPRDPHEPWSLTLAVGVPTELAISIPPTLAELFVVYEIPSNTLRSARERLTLRWFASGATLEHSEQMMDGVELDRVAPYTNVVTLGPSGQATIWLVLQDDRGGVSWRRIDLRAEPETL